jgi:hypothetical protein
MIKDINYVLADSFSVSTEGLLDENIGVVTLGWLIQVSPERNTVEIYIDELLEDQRREWWLRKDNSDPWFGPLMYRDANSQARRMTMQRYLSDPEVKYAQLGTIVGGRIGDPIQNNPHMLVAFMYANGKQYLGGRLAEYNSDLVPV